MKGIGIEAAGEWKRSLGCEQLISLEIFGLPHTNNSSSITRRTPPGPSGSYFFVCYPVISPSFDVDRTRPQVYPSHDLKSALESVLWIGGAPDSGKTSVAILLAERHDLPIYHFDLHEMEHFARAGRATTPALWASHPDRMTTDERWLGASPEEMARATIASWSERCRMAFDDIALLATDRQVIAEGPGFFPDLLLPMLTDKRKAVWLVPTEDFKRRSAVARGKPGNRHETSNPAQATANIIARDLLMGEAIHRACKGLDLTCLMVGGNEGIDAVVMRVEHQFRPWLRQWA